MSTTRWTATATVIAVAAAAAAAGCHSKSSDSSGGGAAGGQPPAARAGDAADALWDLAPDHATIGIVAVPHAVTEGANAFAALRALVAQPDFAQSNRGFGEMATAFFGSPTATPADAGVALDRGLAVFLVEDELLAVLPVADRAKFVAAHHGTADATAKDTDKFGELTCKQLTQGYTCASKPELLARIGKQSLRGRAAAAGARGDIEVFIAQAASGGMLTADSFVTADLDDGIISVRGLIAAPPTGPFAMFAKTSAPHAELTGNAGFAAIDLSPVLATLPAEPRVFGLSPADIGHSLKGPFTVTAATGAVAMTAIAPLSDPAPLTTLLGHCGELSGALPGLAATPSAHGCDFAVTQPFPASVSVAVDNSALRIELHAGSAAAPGAPDVATPIAKELATGDWSYAIWGRGTMLSASPVPFGALAAQAPEGAANVSIHAFTLFSELGAGFKFGADGLHFRLLVRTAYANPPEVVAKLLAVTPADILAGKGAERGKEIADAAPSSPFAGDHAAGASGIMLPVAFVGMVAAVAIPAFVDYLKKSKGHGNEAELMLDRLSKNSKIYFITNATFVAGDQPLTPAKTCCTQSGKCPVDLDQWKTPTWQALDFQIDEPHLFQYGYHSDGKTADLTAVGDLDCDGIAITYTMHMDAEGGNVRSQLTKPAPNSD